MSDDSVLKTRKAKRMLRALKKEIGPENFKSVLHGFNLRLNDRLLMTYIASGGQEYELQQTKYKLVVKSHCTKPLPKRRFY